MGLLIYLKSAVFKHFLNNSIPQLAKCFNDLLCLRTPHRAVNNKKRILFEFGVVRIQELKTQAQLAVDFTRLELKSSFHVGLESIRYLDLVTVVM